MTAGMTNMNDTAAAPRALIFDMGRVLLRIDTEQPRTLHPEAFFDISRMMRFSSKDDRTFLEFNRGTITPEEFWHYICRIYRKEITFAQFKAVWTGIFSAMPGMEELLAELRAAGNFRLGLLSDTDPLHWEHICGAFPWIPASFPCPTLSFREKLLKPAPEIFLRAAADVGCAPNECLFIDDRADNVAGARAAGMPAEQFTGADALRTLLATFDRAPNA